MTDRSDQCAMQIIEDVFDTLLEHSAFNPIMEAMPLPAREEICAALLPVITARLVELAPPLSPLVPASVGDLMLQGEVKG